MKGRLKHSLSFWRSIGASDYVLSVIASGYTIPLVSDPPPAIFRNNKSARVHSNFVNTALQDLLAKGCVVPCKHNVKPRIVSPLSVSVNSDGKERLILDLTYLNTYVLLSHVKYDDWSVFFQYVQHGGYMFKFDLKSGYHHVEIMPHQHTYLGFCWKLGGRNQYFTFTVLPFGLCTGPYVFTKLCRPLVKHWRGKGFKIALYLDDGIGTAVGRGATRDISCEVQSDLRNSGFVVNEGKSVWEPSPTLEWLGLLWDLQNGVLQIPKRRIVALQSCAQSVKNRLNFTSARRLAKLTGCISSISPVTGTLSKLQTRYLHMVINTRTGWDTVLDISRCVQCVREIDFWIDNVASISTRVFFNYTVPSVACFSDASEFAGAAHVYLNGQLLVAHKNWSVTERAASSTLRELSAVSFSLSSFADKLAGQVVKWFSDNQNVPRIIKAGSMKPTLQSIALEIWAACLRHQITLQPEWIPRELNTRADMLSKYRDPDDWEVTNTAFQWLSARWGPFTVDRFASSENNKVPVFYSKFWNPGTAGVDAFSCDWSLPVPGTSHRPNNWLVPPVNLVTRTIKHMIKCRATGTLVIPEWPSALYWPILVDIGGKWQPWIKNVARFPRARDILKSGHYPKCFFHSNPGRTPMVALRIVHSHVSLPV